jgi:hypothetical protein
MNRVHDRAYTLVGRPDRVGPHDRVAHPDRVGTDGRVGEPA